MQWKTPGHKKSSFVKSFLKKDAEEHPSEEDKDAKKEPPSGARWKLQRKNPTQFVLDFFTRSGTDEEEEEGT